MVEKRRLNCHITLLDNNIIDQMIKKYLVIFYGYKATEYDNIDMKFRVDELRLQVKWSFYKNNILQYVSKWEDCS